MGKRNYLPCRVCGCKHKNPASSSICNDCGEKEHFENLEAKALFEEQQTFYQQSLNDAAPDMYRALCDVADELPAEPDELGYTITLTQEEVDAIRAALAKAEREV